MKDDLDTRSTVFDHVQHYGQKSPTTASKEQTTACEGVIRGPSRHKEHGFRPQPALWARAFKASCLRTVPFMFGTRTHRRHASLVDKAWSNPMLTSLSLFSLPVAKKISPCMGVRVPGRYTTGRIWFICWTPLLGFLEDILRLALQDSNLRNGTLVDTR